MKFHVTRRTVARSSSQVTGLTRTGVVSERVKELAEVNLVPVEVNDGRHRLGR